jgi:hypothetical protein
MKTKLFPRLWIAITGLVALLGGWMVFSHTQPSDLISSLIPASSESSTTSQTTSSQSSQSTLQQLPSRSSRSGSTMLRARGS